MISTWLLRANRELEGLAEPFLSLALVFVALMLMVIALRGPASLKALALSWVVLP